MKIYLKLTMLITLIAFSSCEEVIEVDLQTIAQKLVVDASLDWEKGTLGNEQTITLSTSVGYYDTTTNISITGAEVKVINESTGQVYVFIDQDNGDYITGDFVPVINHSFRLEVQYKEETYTATETLKSVVDIIEVSDSNEDEDDPLGIKISFDDPELEENFYLLKIRDQSENIVELFGVNDKFSNGNRFNLVYEKEENEDEGIKEFQIGDVVDVELLGISEQYYDFIEILNLQSGGGGLFETIPATLKGNIINLTNSANFANGYFRLTEVSKDTHTFQ